VGKIRLPFIVRSALAIAVALLFGSAHAQTVLSFTASGTGGATTNTSSYTYTEFDLTLNTVNGVSASSFSVAQGDVIDATITFSPSASVTIPSNAAYTAVSLQLEGTVFDGSPVVASNGSASATLAGSSAGGSPYDSCSTSSQICDPGLYIAPGTLAKFSLDTYKTDFTVSTLDNPATITSADFGVFTPISAVPEPGTYALMVVGLGTLWLAVRRRTGSASMSLYRAA
jgi:hypothetical protein